VTITLHVAKDPALAPNIATSIKGLELRLVGASSGDRFYDVTRTAWDGHTITIHALVSSTKSTVTVEMNGYDAATTNGNIVAFGKVDVATSVSSAEETLLLGPPPSEGDGGTDGGGLLMTLTVNFAGSGTGTFSATVGSMVCNSGRPDLGTMSAKCQFPKHPGNIDVVATNGAAGRLSHLDGCDSYSDPRKNCTLATANLGGDRTITITFDNNNYMFVTRDIPNNVIGSIADGNTFCQTQAGLGGLPTDHSYMAWLSDDSTDATSQVTGHRAWIRPDGKPFADDVAHGNFTVLYPPRIDQFGDDTIGYITGNFVEVMTGTQASGTRDSGKTCVSWTSTDNAKTYTTGFAGSGGGAWTAATSVTHTCDARTHLTGLRLYCFELGGFTAPLPTPTPITEESDARRMAFVTSLKTPITSGGIQALDDFCNSSIPQLTGSSEIRHYSALVAHTSTTGSQPYAMDRFPVGDGKWYRPDGVQVIDLNASGVFTRILAPIDLDEHGASVIAADPIKGEVWTGGTNPFDTSNTPKVCAPPAPAQNQDWTVSGSGQSRVGRVHSSDTFFFDDSWANSWGQCNAGGNRLYCLETGRHN
jgi:hypothetical protein